MFKFRKEIRMLGRCLAYDLDVCGEKWKIDTGSLVRHTNNGDVSIHLYPQHIRLFDSIYVRVNGADVWLPFLQRLRLRRKARRLLVRKARTALGHNRSCRPKKGS